MLPHQNRLLNKKDFEQLRFKGKRAQSDCFGLLFLPNQLSVSRFGFVVSTKLSKKATRRNRVKRLLREAVRSCLPDVAPGVDVVFLGKKGLMDKDFLQIQDEVKQALHKAGLMKK